MTSRMVDIRHRIADYFRTPLAGRRRSGDYFPTLVTMIVAIVVAILLVHAFSPGGLTVTELAVHVVTLTSGFAAGLALAGIVVLSIVRRRHSPQTVALLWLVSAVGFGAGLLIVGIVQGIPLVRDVASKASSIHGAGSLLPRLLPVWAILTAYVARAEILRTYESRLELLQHGVGRHAGSAGWHDVVSIASGKSNRRFTVSSIVCVNAAENYCELLVENEGRIKATLLRATFSSVLDALPHPMFVQVHRSHAVNLGHVRRVERRGRHLVLVMADDDIEIPVSRRRLREVMARVDASTSDR